MWCVNYYCVYSCLVAKEEHLNGSVHACLSVVATKEIGNSQICPKNEAYLGACASRIPRRPQGFHPRFCTSGVLYPQCFRFFRLPSLWKIATKLPLHNFAIHLWSCSHRVGNPWVSYILGYIPQTLGTLGLPLRDLTANGSRPPLTLPQTNPPLPLLPPILAPSCACSPWSINTRAFPQQPWGLSSRIFCSPDFLSCA